jgi:pimeloyl-ACP methyl ester carboxylesterase
MSLPGPVIVVPGITASYLRDEYPISPDTVWAVIKKDYARVTLHPDDDRYEAIEPARVRPDQLNTVAYSELIEELENELSPSRKEKVPVYPFVYDWRMPLDETEKQLALFVKEVIQRTLLQRHYHEDVAYRKKPTVNLVGHSMGGLIVSGYLQRAGKKARVNKVVTLATPFQGAPEAILEMLTGTTSWFPGDRSSRKRAAARITPALYHLLPSFPKAVYDAKGKGHDIFKATNWQPSVLESLTDFVREHALKDNDINGQAEQLFNSLLKRAYAHRKRVNSFRLGQAGLTRSDWLAVVGVDAKTRDRVRTSRDPEPKFHLESKDRLNNWEKKKDRARTGDGTVPFCGAVPKFLSKDNLVCVSPDDFGYWELADKGLTRVAGFHGILPNMNMVHRLIARFIKGTDDNYGNTWGRKAPGANAWKPPLPLREK